MPDQDFEKQIRKKMGELKIRPSDTVWQSVESEIRREKRRRRVIGWLPLLLLLGTAGYWGWDHYTGMASHRVAATHPGATDASSSANARSPKKEDQLSGAHRLPSASPQETLFQNDTHRDQAMRRPAPASLPGRHLLHPALQPGKANPTGSPDAAAPISEPSSGAPDEDAARPVTPEKNRTAESSRAGEGDSAEALAFAPQQGPALPTDSIKARDTAQAVARQPDKKPKAPATAPQKPPVFHKWQWAIEASAGWANTHTTSGQSPAAQDFPSNLNSYALAVTSSFASTKHAVAVTPAFSFSIGALAQYRLSRKLTVDAGLFYSRLNTRQAIGKMVSSNLVVNLGTLRAQNVSPYYVADHNSSYTNHYDFIGIPVHLQWQFARIGQLPLYWTNGLSVSRLVGSNALYYDNNAGVYYKNSSFLNKTQWSASSELSIGLRNHSKIPVQAGPVFNYNFSNLLNASTGTGHGHLLYFGLGIKLLLK